MAFSRLAYLALRAARAWRDDRAGSMGAALAFYTLFSLAPLLLIAIAVAGLFVGRGDAESLMLAQVTQLIGEEAAETVKTILAASGERNASYPAILGIGMLLLGAATVFRELRADLDIVWKCEPAKSRGFRGFMRARLLTFGMVLAIGFLLIVSLIASTVLTAITTIGPAALARAGEFAVSFLAITVLFAMIYKWLPSVRMRWSDVWVGAAVTSLLFWVGKYLIGLYLAHSTVGSTFGAAGTVVVIISWVYYSAQVFLLGAEFTREYALAHGSLRGAAPSGVQAANQPDIMARARQIVGGRDPVLLRRGTQSP